MSKKDSHYYSGPPFDAISQVGQMQVVGKPLKQLDHVFHRVFCLRLCLRLVLSKLWVFLKTWSPLSIDAVLCLFLVASSLFL